MKDIVLVNESTADFILIDVRSARTYQDEFCVLVHSEDKNEWIEMDDPYLTNRLETKFNNKRT